MRNKKRAVILLSILAISVLALWAPGIAPDSQFLYDASKYINRGGLALFVVIRAYYLYVDKKNQQN